MEVGSSSGKARYYHLINEEYKEELKLRESWGEENPPLPTLLKGHSRSLRVAPYYSASRGRA